METKSINTKKGENENVNITLNMVNKKNKKKIKLDEEKKLETNGNICKLCLKVYKTRAGLWKHLKKCNKIKMTAKQKSIKSINEMETKEKNEYICNICDYYTSVKCNYEKHLVTKKHIKNCVGGQINKTDTIKSDNSKKENPDTTDLLKMFSEYVKNNEQVQKELIESNKRLIQDIIPNIGNNNNNTNNNISINVFLNEHCKDAISFEEFIKNMQVTIEDVIKTNELGYIDGVSNIFMKNLQILDTKQRPIHCTDDKRMQFFIKEENNWGKDNGEKMEQAINVVSNKQLREVKKLETENKNYFEKEQEKYFSFMSNIMGPLEKEERKKQAKEILKNVGKEVSLKDITIDNAIIKL